MKSIVSGFSASFSIVVTALGFICAGVHAQEITASKGYVEDKSGTVVRSGKSRGCVHSRNWTVEMERIEGCDGVVLAVTSPHALMFEFDSAELTPEGKAAIDKERGKLKSKTAGAYSGVIVGHTDSSGDPNYNIWLSKQRAVTVHDYIVGDGAEARKISVVGVGSEFPIASNETRDGRKSNRRVEVIFKENIR